MNPLISGKNLRLAQALQSRAFAWFWLGQTISGLGDGAFTIALAVAVYQLTGSSLAMGLFLTAQILPEVLFTLFGGVAADRLPRRLVLVGADTGRALIVLLIAGLSWFGVLHLWQLFVLALLFGLARAFFGPAYRAITPELVAREHFASANALTSLSIHLGNFLGPILGASFLALGAGSTSTAFAFDGLTFVISVCSLLAIRAMPMVAGQQSDTDERKPFGLKSVLQDMREGFGVILGSTWLLWSMLAATFGLVAYAGAIAVSLPKMVFAVYGSGPWLFAAITTAASTGAIAATVFVGQAHLRRRGVIAFLGYILAGLALIAFSIPLPHSTVAFVVIPAAFAVGFGMNVMYMIWATLLYELVPNDKLGRVASVDLLGSLGLLPVGYALAGWLSDHLGPSAVFLLGGLVLVVLDCIPLFLRAIRNLQ